MNLLIRDLERMLSRLIGEDIEMELALSLDIGPVMADPGQVEQVILNLVVNARDAMPRGGRLLIGTREEELDTACAAVYPGLAPGRYVLLSVTDTGCGMSSDILKNIFDPFFTTKDKGRGTGLGLSTVHGIVRQSGGNIRVDSEPGHGTTFTIYLPLTRNKGAARVESSGTVIPSTGKEHILVVEDDECMRRLMASLLARLGYTATMAANGGEALFLVEEKKLRFDMIITDVVMPNLSGKALIDRLMRKDPQVKVIYMSGYPPSVIAQHAILDPGALFIQKPFTIPDLAQKIRTVLSGLQPSGSD